MTLTRPKPHLVSVRWTCRNYVTRKVFGLDAGRGKCGAVFETETTAPEVADRLARAKCQQCGGIVTQRADGMEVLS